MAFDGVVTAIGDVDVERDPRPMAHRHLGPEPRDQYVQALSAEADSSVLVRVRPERWRSVDYTKQFGG